MFDELNFFFGIFIYGIFYSYLRILTCIRMKNRRKNSLTNEASLKEKKKLLFLLLLRLYKILTRGGFRCGSSTIRYGAQKIDWPPLNVKVS